MSSASDNTAVHTLREGLPPLPKRMRSLRIDARGYPVPYFVAWIDGAPDFRCIEVGRIAHCHNNRLCWLCGQPMGRYKTFVMGPMCAVNRVSSEPPSHLECADFSARACPFLTLPKSQRRERNLPDHKDSAGVGLKRNPGVTLLWTTLDYTPFRVQGGHLFRIGDQVDTRWYAEGRTATRDEVMASIDSGLPLLREVADQQDREEPGAGAVRELERMTADALQFVPA